MNSIYRRVSRPALFAVFALAAFSTSADSASIVFVGFGAGPTGWKPNLDMLMGTVMAAPLAPGEVGALEGIILSELDRI
jgi:hypothetical protein